MRTARFDSNDHAVTEGWATYHKDLKGRLALPPFVCRVFGHPRVAPPKSRNGHSPSNYARCRRCNRWMKWYVVRQHRYGGMDAAAIRHEGEAHFASETNYGRPRS